MSETNEKDISTKVFFIKYGICTGFLAVFLIIVIYTVRVAHSAWYKNLKFSVESCLDEVQPGAWAVGSSVDIANPYAMSAACYETRNRVTGETCYSVIARLMTYYGPVNGVFLCSNEGEVTFVGVSSVRGRIWEQVRETKNSAKIKYFSDRLPLIIGISPEVGND